MKIRRKTRSATHTSLTFIAILALLGLLSACGGGGGGTTAADPVFLPTPTNAQPTVSAGDNRNVVAGSVVSLTGTATDSDGSIASTTWQQSSGETVTLTDATTLVATFTAPSVTTNTTLAFALEATDDDGAANSAVVTVTIIPTNNNRVLLGPLIGANVVVTRIGNSSETLATTTTDATSDLAIGGGFSLPLDGLAANEWVLVTVTGGSDIDADDDNVLDTAPTLNAGTVRALGKVSDWRTGGANVTALSEIAVRRLLNGDVNLDTLDATSIEIQLTGLAQELLSTGLDGNSRFDYRDILAFTPAAGASLRSDTLNAAAVTAFAQALLNADNASADAALITAFTFETFATINTNLGAMKFQLFRSVTPNTVINFTSHAQSGFYDTLIFHRVIANFIIQGGDPNGNGTGGASILGGNFNDEFSETLSNVAGTLSMANSGPNTNSSQFFVNLSDNVNLDFNKAPSTSAHTVFGRIVEGNDVLAAIANVSTNTSDRPLTDVVIQSIVISRQ
jgi:cyclophilin family peptidyl-prolyl cis-trans isomerase